MALDIGTKRIGVAVCDALYIGATPIKTIERKDDIKTRKETEEIKTMFKNLLKKISRDFGVTRAYSFWS